MRVATVPVMVCTQPHLISIHATHAGGDVVCSMTNKDIYISIHATHAGGDLFGKEHPFDNVHFNPRHPCGWRLVQDGKLQTLSHFNPRHPCGWRPREVTHIAVVCISIHATHAGGDWDLALLDTELAISIHATHAGGDYDSIYQSKFYNISIHATHAGGDS